MKFDRPGRFRAVHIPAVLTYREHGEYLNRLASEVIA